MNTDGSGGRKGRGALALASVLVGSVVGLISVSESASGAGMRSDPLADGGMGRPLVLDQEGRRIMMIGGRGGVPPRLPAGVAPTYLAYRLGDPSRAPEGAPSVSTVPGRGGPAVGPLRLDALAKASLDAELAKAGQVALVTPRQSFLIESWGNSVLSDVAGESWTWRAEVEPPARGPGAGAGARPGGRGDSLEGTVKDWYKSGSNAIKNWNQQALDAVKKVFKPEAPKPVIIPPETVAAHMLTPPESAALETPAPVPEPGSLVVFAAAAVAAWRFRFGRRRTRGGIPS